MIDSKDVAAKIYQGLKLLAPDFENVDHPEFVQQEIIYKQEISEDALEKLNKQRLQKLLSDGEYQQFYDEVGSVGKHSKNNLLFLAAPTKGDLSVLYSDSITGDLKSFSEKFYAFLYGEDSVYDRIDYFSKWIDSIGVRPKWTFITYYLFVLDNHSELFIKPSIFTVFLDLLDERDRWDPFPTGKLYRYLKDQLSNVGEELPFEIKRGFLDLQSILYRSLKSIQATEENDKSYWFVGATYGEEDQTSRFISEGIWENGHREKYSDLVKSMKPGDRIAIKSAYTRKHNLPFDNRGHVVSVMAIKAIGTIKGNLGDGRTVEVEWVPVDPKREWYFFTHRGTVWQLDSGNHWAKALIEFAFNDKPQDYNMFKNAPYWRERFGDDPQNQQRFQWTSFYEAVADKLLGFQNNRAELVSKIQNMGERLDGISKLQDQYTDGSSGPLKDICPFTAMGIFNRGITEENRKLIAAELAAFLGVEEDVPESFEGIPVLNNQRSWFFSYERTRQPDDIDALWRVFASALRYTDTDDPDEQDSFIEKFDDSISRRLVLWNITTGLYWIRPWSFANPLQNLHKKG